MTPRRHGVLKIARQFWADVGDGECFPRDIERAALRVLPVTIVRLPVLDAAAIAGRLLQWSLGVPLPHDDRAFMDRSFMGCLIARNGCGIIFVHGGDEPGEQRLTLAHEAAHFLLDYLVPRNAVLAALGESATDILDGVRPPTPAERAAAVLRHVRLGPHVHLLSRDEDADAAVAHAEVQADELAMELLAPRHDLLPRLATSTAAELADRYGLPAHVFERLIRKSRREPPVSFLGRTLAAAREGR